MTKTYVIRYSGAPYGDGEAGHIVSEHGSYVGAERALTALGFAAREHDILERCDDGYRVPIEEDPNRTKIFDLAGLA